MEEIKLYYDSAKKQEVKGEVEFEKVDAGKKSKREIFIFNNVEFKMNVELILEGNDIKLIKNINDINPKKLKKVEFELSPKLTTMKPIKAKLKIKFNYVIG